MFSFVASVTSAASFGCGLATSRARTYFGDGKVLFQGERAAGQDVVGQAVVFANE
jgi:hypothetical protein